MMKFVAGRGLGAAAVLVLLGLSFAGCTEVTDSLDSANETMSDAEGMPASSAEQDALADSELLDALYNEGLELQQNGSQEDAIQRFREAAERGHGPAAFELGEAYNEGRGVDQDLNAGAKWINAAAARGERRAQYTVGAAYYNGNNVEQDYVRAATYLADAANQDYAPAQYLLAECYANGRGVTRNLAWAARWYGKAADQGYADGAFSYGVMQAAGLGIPTDMARGYAWLSVADQVGHASAKDVRAAIANKMSPAELERGKTQASKFQPRKERVFADKPTVMYVQHSLNQLGFNAGVVDGLMGPRTRNAIAAYLKSVGAAVSDDAGAGETTEVSITPDLVQRLFESQQNTA
ncbi:hypothetical protein [Pelagibius sp.]|uniref:peptidoglycan-binding protein n=1 Tax=Pelagibius sp. TaxID=1931238 RepID=UPI00260FAE59|nr:hypothetical protein [Pelagibius sp.]